MAIKKETSLQERIQRLVKARGGYVIKTHGDMTTEPGIPDLICCYKSLFIGIEVKVDNNKPTKNQGIHCRLIMKSNGISLVTWSVDDVKILLDMIDTFVFCDNTAIIKQLMISSNLDNGGSY